MRGSALLGPRQPVVAVRCTLHPASCPLKSGRASPIALALPPSSRPTLVARAHRPTRPSRRRRTYPPSPPLLTTRTHTTSTTMPAKKRCQFSGEEKCNAAALRLVGQCAHCRSEFCGDHRLPEHHSCSNLESCRQQAFEKNKAKLESERTVAPKMAMT